MNNTIKKITTTLFILSLLTALSEATEITTDTFSCKIALLDAAELNRVLASNEFTNDQKTNFEIELKSVTALITINKCEVK